MGSRASGAHTTPTFLLLVQSNLIVAFLLSLCLGVAIHSSVFGGPVDFGASIITGHIGNPITLLSNQINGPLYNIRTDACPIYDATGQVVPAKLDARIETQYNRCLDAAAELRQRVPDASVPSHAPRSYSYSYAGSKIGVDSSRYMCQLYKADDLVEPSGPVDESDRTPAYASAASPSWSPPSGQSPAVAQLTPSASFDVRSGVLVPGGAAASAALPSPTADGGVDLRWCAAAPLPHSLPMWMRSSHDGLAARVGFASAGDDMDASVSDAQVDTSSVLSPKASPSATLLSLPPLPVPKIGTFFHPQSPVPLPVPARVPSSLRASRHAVPQSDLFQAYTPAQIESMSLLEGVYVCPCLEL